MNAVALGIEEKPSQPKSEIHSKDAPIQLCGRWIIDIAELEAIGNANRSNEKLRHRDCGQVPPTVRQAHHAIPPSLCVHRDHQRV
jgi:hypothetical protein